MDWCYKPCWIGRLHGHMQRDILPNIHAWRPLLQLEDPCRPVLESSPAGALHLYHLSHAVRSATRFVFIVGCGGCPQGTRCFESMICIGSDDTKFSDLAKSHKAAFMDASGKCYSFYIWDFSLRYTTWFSVGTQVNASMDTKIHPITCHRNCALILVKGITKPCTRCSHNNKRCVHQTKQHQAVMLTTATWQPQKRMTNLNACTTFSAKQIIK